MTGTKVLADDKSATASASILAAPLVKAESDSMEILRVQSPKGEGWGSY